MKKSILITGCSSGFGLDAAKYFADRGHQVYASMRDPGNKNKAAADELRAYSENKNLDISIADIDVTSDLSVTEAVAEMGSIDVLINNAGVGYGGPVETFSSAQMLAQLDLNIVGTLRMAKAVLPGMRAQKSGLIIQVSSTAGRAAFPGFGVYHASKWGLEGISEALRYELAPLGIDVVLVEPGPFSTNFFEGLVRGEDKQVASAYAHVGSFAEGFRNRVVQAFEDKQAPTDPMIVVEVFDQLINMPAGERPLRTIAGLDFGLQAVNDAVEPIRQQGLKNMQIADWDGPKG